MLALLIPTHRELEQKVLRLLPESQGAPGKLSVIVVHGYIEGQDLSRLIGEDMICVTCKAVCLLTTCRNNC